MSRCIINNYVIDECIIVEEIKSITITLNNKNEGIPFLIAHIFEMYVDLDNGYMDGVTIQTINNRKVILFTPSIALPPIYRDDSIEFTFKSQSNGTITMLEL